MAAQGPGTTLPLTGPRLFLPCSFFFFISYGMCSFQGLCSSHKQMPLRSSSLAAPLRHRGGRGTDVNGYLAPLLTMLHDE